MDNYEWLTDLEGEELSDNVAKNIQLLTLKKKSKSKDKTKPLLSLYVCIKNLKLN